MNDKEASSIVVPQTEPDRVCGIIMPISECDGCGPAHWAEVKSVIEMAVRRADMRPRLVSDSFESNLIHREILHNIYNDLVIVVDVSGRNPNVFF